MRKAALNILQIICHLIEIAVLHKVIPQSLKSRQLCRRRLRRRTRCIQRDFLRHRMAFARGRIGDEAPCLKLIIDEGASPAMRTNARQILDLRAAFLADHPSLSFLKKYLLVLLFNLFIIIVSSTA